MSNVFLYHATPGQNRDSIDRRGLLVSKARGKLKAVWLHESRDTLWAIAHVARKHGVPAKDVIVYAVYVEDFGELRRAKGGRFYSRVDRPAHELYGAVSAAKALERDNVGQRGIPSGQATS